MAEFMSHNGAIKTDELLCPGYVWYRCSDYGLPDNTAGQIGYCVIYRPCCRGRGYKDEHLVSDRMIADTREHYRLEREAHAAEEARKHAEFLAALDAEREELRRTGRRAPLPCPRCGTWCEGDCIAAEQ